MKFPWFNTKSKEEKRSVDVNAVLGSETCGAGSLSNQIHQFFYPTGMTLAPLFAAINIISNSCATIPWRFFNVNDAEPLKRNHYLYHLFDNVVVSQFMSIKNVIKDVLVHGNGFLYILRDDASGRPISLIYMPSSNVNINVDLKTGVPYYTNNSMSYLPKYIRAEDMIHFKMHTDDGIRGIGLPICAHNTIETAAYTENAITNYMSSGGNVTGILTPNSTNPNVPTTKKQINEIRQSWDEARANKGSSTIILPADLKFTQLSTSAKDAALIDTRLYNLQEIARWFNISPVLLGDLSHSQYNSISEAQREFVEHTLQPFIVMMEQELNDKLIMPSKKGVEKIDIDERAILVQDKEKQANYLINLVTKGIITPNEARKELDLPEVEGADSLIIAYTNVNDNQVADEQEESKKEEPVNEPQNEETVEESKDEPKEDESKEEESKEESRSKDMVDTDDEDEPKEDEPKEDSNDEESKEDESKDEPKEDESKDDESKDDESKDDESKDDEPKEDESKEEESDTENSTSDASEDTENSVEKDSTENESEDVEDENKTQTTDTTEIVDESESVDDPDIEEEPVKEKKDEDEEPKEDLNDEESKEDEPKEDESTEEESDEPVEEKKDQVEDESKEDEQVEENEESDEEKEQVESEQSEDEEKDEEKDND